MIVTLDTNILYYAFDRQEVTKRKLARDIIARVLVQDCTLTTQVLGEFLPVVRRKNSAAYPDARALVEDWSSLVTMVNTTPDHLLVAADIAERYTLQFWDSVIIAAARSAGVEMMLTEDMQDSAIITGLGLLNPFDPANRERLEALLAS